MRRLLGLVLCFTCLSAAAQDKPVEVKDADRKDGVVYESEAGKLSKWEGPVPLRAGKLGPQIALRCDEILIGFVMLSEAVCNELSLPNSDSGIGFYVKIGSLSDEKKQSYVPWRGAVLTDELGNKYSQTAVQPAVGKAMKLAQEKTRIDSGRDVFDILIFEKPVAKAKKFTLKLPGKNVGVDPDFNFSFTREDVLAAQKVGKK